MFPPSIVCLLYNKRCTTAPETHLTAMSDSQQTPKQEAVDRWCNMGDFEKNALEGDESMPHQNTVVMTAKALVHAIVEE